MRISNPLCCFRPPILGKDLERLYNGIRTALLLYGNPVNKYACQNRLTGMFATFT